MTIYIINPLFTLISFVKIYCLIFKTEFKDDNDIFIYKYQLYYSSINLLLIPVNFILLLLNIIILICSIPVFIILLIMSHFIIFGLFINESCCIPPSEKPIIQTTAEYVPDIKIEIIIDD